MAADFAQFHPVFRHALGRILDELRGIGWEPRVASGMRTAAQQAEKLRKGYSKTMKSWHVRSTFGLLPLDQESFDVVFGNAADVIDRRWGWSGPASSKSFIDLLAFERVATTKGGVAPAVALVPAAKSRATSSALPPHAALFKSPIMHPTSRSYHRLSTFFLNGR